MPAQAADLVEEGGLRVQRIRDHPVAEMAVACHQPLDLETQSLTRYAPGEPARTWSGADAVVEEPMLPGFYCRLAELLAEE